MCVGVIADNSRTCSKRTQLENRVSDRRQMTPLFSDSSVDVTSLNGSQGLSSSSSNSSLVNLELTSSSNVTCQSSRHRSHAQPSLANRQPLLELSSNQSSWSSSRPSQQSVWSQSQNSSFDSDSSLSCLSSNTARTCCEQEDSSDSDMWFVDACGYLIIIVCCHALFQSGDIRVTYLRS